MVMQQIPVYAFTGFLDSGKTKFIQETLEDPRFNAGERTLVLIFEEGEEEYDLSTYPKKNVYLEVLDQQTVTTEELKALQKKYKAERVVAELNGMQQVGDLYMRFPDNWAIAQEVMFADATTFMTYNANMRQLTFDKLQSCELAVFNRYDSSMDKMEFHKLVRALSRSAAIIYEKATGEIAYDEIEDPLPFDKEAPVIVIEDKDYALFYRDLAENLEDYRGKRVRFKAMVASDKSLGTGTMFVGRHVMTCCAADIKYTAMVCKWGRSGDWKNYDWVTVEGVIDIRRHKAYEDVGPVLMAEKVEAAEKPDEPVATFY